MPEKKDAARWTMLEDDHPHLELPELDGAEYIAEAFMGSGLVGSGGMGMQPISWQELDAFCSRSVTGLNGWEAKQVMRMSRAYCSMHKKAEKPNCLPPYVSDEQSQLEKAREIVVQRMKAMKAARKSANK